ncbi:DUF6090 family protein [Yeosuana sp. MJ-SS3]|uniref:DUF6090 family protein n=1 Tax=Gilvirhabdus luticola TaxID=3079858 RepID=A0ABU3UA17_9FLAO|nr:DUF6090 family protein [Yeosuana sp. MJ-SS3]MDU8887226.1 DUF6090 family protein [Yeosuana sp. MJ-SS3]
MENKTFKYLKYAIGEIVLVVIGILIALQINNWNEQRKLKKIELDLLVELNNVLEGSKMEGGKHGGELEFQKIQIDENKKSLASSNYLINHFDQELPFNDSLKFHFANAHTRYIAFIRDQAYENIKNYGLGFIKNDSLRAELIRAYETNTQWLLELNTRNNLYESNTVIPLLVELFENVRMEDYEQDKFMIPTNFELLKNNIKYLTILKTTKSRRVEYLLYQERRYQRLQMIHKFLQKEIAFRTDYKNND